MKRFLIIPQINDLDGSIALAEKYGMGFEYNDFFRPDVLDDTAETERITAVYKNSRTPGYCTMHGAFFDVVVSSVDKKIREVSALRVEQSMKAAQGLGVKGVVFHSNFNPFFTSENFIAGWAEDNAAFWSGILKRYPDINIYIENMFDRTPYAVAALSERLCGHPNFGLCFDYAHAALSGLPHSEWAAAIGKYVKHIHINDNDLVSDLHLAVGDGKIDWNGFYKLYEQYMPDASVLIETSSSEYAERSAEKLKKDGFFT